MRKKGLGDTAAVIIVIVLVFGALAGLYLMEGGDSKIIIDDWNDKKEGATDTLEASGAIQLSDTDSGNNIVINTTDLNLSPKNATLQSITLMKSGTTVYKIQLDKTPVNNLDYTYTLNAPNISASEITNIVFKDSEDNKASIIPTVSSESSLSVSGNIAVSDDNGGSNIVVNTTSLNLSPSDTKLQTITLMEGETTIATINLGGQTIDNLKYTYSVSAPNTYASEITNIVFEDSEGEKDSMIPVVK